MIDTKESFVPPTVDNIRAELSLPAPTPHTLRFLRSILGLDVPVTHKPVLTASKEPPKRTTRVRAPAQISSKPRRNAPPKVQIHENSTEKCPRLSLADRRKVATDVFNASLKQLGQAAKAEQVASRSRIAGTTPLQPPSVQRALHERSPNRERKKEAIPLKKAVVQNETPDLRIVADLSHSALHFLRQCETNEQVQGSTNDKGLENAALVLLDRTITLKLVAQAQRQLAEVHQRYLGKNSVRQGSSAEESNIDRYLLGRPDAVEQASTFGFTTSLQSQVVRLALLLGPKAITKEVLHALQPDTVGSPAWTSMQGLQKGLHTSEQAGLQLRTISLALSKLYSIGLKSDGQTVPPNCLFDLFCLALRVKFESWTYLGHSPAPESEVWRHFHAAAKKLFATATTSGSPATAVLQYVRQFQRLLSLAGCSQSIPSGLVLSLIQLTQSDPQTEILLLAEESMGSTDTITSLILCCYSTASRLKLFTQDSDAALGAVQRTTKAFDKSPALSEAGLQKLLLYTAYLRKAALEVMTAVEAKHKDSDEKTTMRRMQTAIVKLIYTLSRTLCRQINTVLSEMSSESRKARGDAFLTTLVKNVEGVLATEKCAVTQEPEMEQAACGALISCSDIVDTLLAETANLPSTSTMRAAVGQLNVRLSNIFWIRFLKLVQQRRRVSEQIAMLEQSVKGLPGLEMADQKAAYLGLKYERLAICYLETGDHGMAKSMLRNAIDFSTKEGTLSEVVELILSGCLRSAWSKPDSNCKSLARNLSTYTRLSLDTLVATGVHDIFYDNPSLPPLHRAVLLEKQIYSMAEKDMNDQQLALWRAQVQFTFKLLSQSQYRVLRLKFGTGLVHYALRRRIPSLPDIAELCSVMDSDQKTGGGTFLAAFESGLRSLFTLQLGSLTGQMTKNVLEQNVKRLWDIVRPCKSLEDAELVLEDLESTILPLQLCVDYAATFDSPAIALMSLEALYHVLELGVQSPGLSKTTLLLQMSRFHHSLHDTQSAAKALSTAEKTMRSEETAKHLEVELALAYAEHYLNTDKVEQCFDWLDRAESARNTRQGIEGPTPSRSRLKEQTILCAAAHLTARLAFHQGRLSEAATCGRQAAKIAGAIWLSIEKACQSNEVEMTASTDGDLESLTMGISKLNLSSQQNSWLRASAIVYSQQITLHCSVFGSMAALNAHCGLYQTAAWFYEEALKVARKTGRSLLEAGLLSNIALLEARAGHVDKAWNMLDDLSAGADANMTPFNHALVAINQAETYLLLGDRSAADRCFAEARQHMQPEPPRPKSRQVDQGSKKKTPNPPAAKAKVPARKPAVKSRVKTAAAVIKPAETRPVSATLTIGLRMVHESLSTLEAKLQMLKDPRDGKMCPSSGMDGDDELVNVRKSMADALRLVQTALKLFSEDAENNVLAETAMALPVRYRSARKSGRVSFVQAGTPLVRSNKGPEPNKKSSHKGADGTRTKDGKTLLLEAYNILSMVKGCRQSLIPSDIVHTIHKILAQISLLSTALGHPFLTSSLELVLDKLSPMDLVRDRERLLTLSEQATADTSDIQSWPHLEANHATDHDDRLDIDVDLLPAAWSVVSIGLNEDRSELLVSRLNNGRSPFIVRIPLTRPDTSDAETEDLDFDTAKAELQEIIAKANSSAHDPRGCSADKAVRRAWYDERKALDRHLATLLDNIEGVWFGGFRGLIAAPDVDETALLKFGQSFSMTLNRHLPSRRKASKVADSKVELHNHVLELFVTLGHPREAELEDAITDLLYFVIDVLQINGERNAYDEVDFDSMLVEVLDALHAYHEEQSRRAKGNASSHVILVVDKELQLFPWESLSCLKGRPVSRMPSLGTIWQRLQAIRQQAKHSDWYVIPASEGTYVLNPSSDLTSTQDTFGEVFETQLSGFHGIVNRAPQEKEFEEALQAHSLMLYFGHGGGAQYIRGCKIRRMDKCAVTLLMGCSSAKLTECGVYEPYGVPWNYLNGGSPAVVGNLWDVTDRDIDRFAMKLMTGWGLIEDKGGVSEAKPGAAKGGISESSTRTASKAGRGKTEKEKRVVEKRGPGLVSLDEAVAQARDECLLKYLNGAAPVIYGVPVFLE